jgi:hypothetical protein
VADEGQDNALNQPAPASEPIPASGDDFVVKLPEGPDVWVRGAACYDTSSRTAAMDSMTATSSKRVSERPT